MQRRTLLKLGIAGTAVLATVGGLAVLLRPGWQQGRLTEAGRALYVAVSGAILDGMLPVSRAARDEALSAHTRRIETAVGGLHPATRAEVAQLTALLLHPAGRLLVADLPTDWAAADTKQVTSALQSMRSSTLDLRQQAYQALRELVNGPWFADPESWAAVGYPGPRAV